MRGFVGDDCAGDLDHLHERGSPLLHPGTPGGGEGEQRQLFGGGPSDSGGQALAGGDSDRPPEKPEVAHQHCDAAAANRCDAGDDCFIEPGFGPRARQLLGILMVDT